MTAAKMTVTAYLSCERTPTFEQHGLQLHNNQTYILWLFRKIQKKWTKINYREKCDVTKDHTIKHKDLAILFGAECLNGIKGQD